MLELISVMVSCISGGFSVGFLLGYIKAKAKYSQNSLKKFRCLKLKKPNCLTPTKTALFANEKLKQINCKHCQKNGICDIDNEECFIYANFKI
ncbi:hypothetical protein [Campylobacter fetus]|uniref:hypothetical protein n=1 Tax=Campylobacter fetus TaxID=196 RepID=UPI00073AAB03|nr:hypothetical protein [Campylobacter fetus]ALV64634.1 hypothetical protein CFTSP3_0665 [Campylobacter fetus subsp. testudinum Sp3]